VTAENQAVKTLNVERFAGLKQTRRVMMAKIKMHAGDFGEETVSISISEYSLTLRYDLDYSRDSFWALSGQSVALYWKDVEEIVEASEENVKRLGGTVGWGVVGAAVLGPVGLLAGLLAGGRGKDVTFVLKMKDERKMLATTDSKTFTKLKAKMF
jgi:hypothetical protein